MKTTTAMCVYFVFKQSNKWAQSSSVINICLNHPFPGNSINLAPFSILGIYSLISKAVIKKQWTTSKTVSSVALSCSLKLFARISSLYKYVCCMRVSLFYAKFIYYVLASIKAIPMNQHTFLLPVQEVSSLLDSCVDMPRILIINLTTQYIGQILCLFPWMVHFISIEQFKGAKFI